MIIRPHFDTSLHIPENIQNIYGSFFDVNNMATSLGLFICIFVPKSILVFNFAIKYEGFILIIILKVPQN